jgi:hypothetical protein
MPTETQNMCDTINVLREKPEGSKEVEGFMPRNTLLRSPIQSTLKSIPPPESSTKTPPTKVCTPEDINKAPRKKTTKLLIAPDELEPTHNVDKSISKMARNGNSVELNLENLLETMQSVHDALLQPTLRGEQKADARSKMVWAMECVKAMHGKNVDNPAPQRTSEERACHKEIMTELAEIRKAVKQTYAQAAQRATVSNTVTIAQTTDHNHTTTAGHNCKSDLEQDRIRSAQAKKDVVLTIRDASDAMKEIANLEDDAITKNLQELIQQNASTATIKVQNIRKLANHIIRIRCYTEHDATQIKELNWTELLEGAKVMRPEYGVVIHGASKYSMTNIEQFKRIIEDKNDIKIKRVALLRKNARNPDAPTQSIIIFMESPEEANKCIDDSIITPERTYKAERYKPQCQIKQCFNCQAYGHKADTCRKKRACGRCAQEHQTRDCTNEQVKCVNCKEAHVAWHHQCSRRQEIAHKMETQKAVIPATFTC